MSDNRGNALTCCTLLLAGTSKPPWLSTRAMLLPKELDHVTCMIHTHDINCMRWPACTRGTACHGDKCLTHTSHPCMAPTYRAMPRDAATVSNTASRAAATCAWVCRCETAWACCYSSTAPAARVAHPMSALPAPTPCACFHQPGTSFRELVGFILFWPQQHGPLSGGRSEDYSQSRIEQSASAMHAVDKSIMQS